MVFKFSYLLYRYLDFLMSSRSSFFFGFVVGKVEMVLLYLKMLILYKKPLFSEVGRLNFVQYVFVLDPALLPILS